ncbi:MAG TPA: cytochrome P450 [Nocardioidaceae bacterium]|nr:cytochrome P450 [Nocardioidaceae bacterium]
MTVTGASPRLPPGSTLPRAALGVVVLTSRRRALQSLTRRYGSAFTVNLPMFGRCVFVSDPALVRQLFLTSNEIVGNIDPNLGRILGPGSLFNLEGAEHHRTRRLLVPPFHGKRMSTYEQIVEEETLREARSWPERQPFAMLPSTMRITLNAILRAVFGAEGAEFEQLRVLLPRFVELGSRLAVMPVLSRDLGTRSPGGRFMAYRAQFDEVIDTLVARALADPGLAERDDVLALMLQSRYDDGERIGNRDLADQLLTLLAAGHETTATTLAWTVERLRRHPALLERLVAEAEDGGSELRAATILEVQRSRSVIDLVGRHVHAESLELGEWRIPRGYNVMVAIGLVHENESVFPNASAFDPDRFLNVSPDYYAWVPFGGGTRRCIGAAFANMEMNVVLRTLLREFTLVPTNERDERWHSRGVAFAPARGGRTVLARRR